MSQIADMRAEFQRENQEMLETIRQLSREVKLQALIIDSYIPKEYQELLEGHASWHEETGEWHMVRFTYFNIHNISYTPCEMTLQYFFFHFQHGIAYAGNNMRKQPSPDPVDQVSKQQGIIVLLKLILLSNFLVSCL